MSPLRHQMQATIQLIAIGSMTKNSGMNKKPIVVLGDPNNHYIFEKAGRKVSMTATVPADLAYAIAYIKELLLLRAKDT